MLYMERWKVYLILAICVWSLAYASPNLMSADTLSWMQKNLPSVFPTQNVNLGLDLRGGSHLLLEVKVDSVVEEKLQGLLDQTRSELRTAKVGYLNLRLSNGAISFVLTDESQADAAKEALRSIDGDLNIDRDGKNISVKFSEKSIVAMKRSAMGQSVEIVRRRIDETGTREPSIQRQGDNRILVQLPGLNDPQRIKKLLGQTAKLTFRLVDENSSFDSRITPPPGTERLASAEKEGQSYVVQKRVMISGDKLVDAQPSFQNSEAVVSFKFDSMGGKQFGEATRSNVGRLFAIVLDNKVISAPVIREPILGGSGVISGHFTTQSAQDLALLLRAGALPAQINVLEERTVGPGLGEDSIKSGAIASFAGLGLVIVFMVVVYGLFGLFADISLLFSIAMIFAILSTLQATLTLPGIAGIVLTIGTALDANVLVYERIREELRLGRSPMSAIDAGYKHALPAIVDANMTSLIASIILYAFGSGPVRGFAVTLTIGIVSSIFSGLMITRLIVVAWFRLAKPKEIPI